MPRLLVRYLPLATADQTLGMPAGVVGSWVRTGMVPLVWFVHRGQIVQGVPLVPCLELANYRRAAAIARAVGGR